MRNVLLAVALALATACGGGGGEDGGAKSQLVVKDYKFPELTVKAGSAIEVVNKDTENHTVTADGGAFDLKLVKANESATLTAPATGSYPYTCTIHANMKGTLIVQ